MLEVGRLLARGHLSVGHVKTQPGLDDTPRLVLFRYQYHGILGTQAATTVLSEAHIEPVSLSSPYRSFPFRVSC